MSYIHRGAPMARRTLSLGLVVALPHLVACSTKDPSQESATPSAPIAKTQQGVWINGDFEDSAIGVVPNGWTLSTYLNMQGGVEGMLGSPPDTFAKLRLGNAGVGTAATQVIGGAPESQVDPSLGSAGSLRLPKYGQRAVRVNETNISYGANGLSQTMKVSLGDVDPLDDKVHVRFAVAPVLNNPSHAYAQQPYYFVQLRNLTRNTTLYTDFNVSAQEGVPWKSVGSTLLYTDWQLVDIAPGNATLAVGDDVQLTVVASNCAQGGASHFARLYVDAVGSGVPGLYSWATGPQSANSGEPITYTINYKNGGTTSTSGTKVAFVTPPNTTFVSSTGGSCSAPAVGATGTLECTVGTLAPGGTGAFTATVRINNGTTGTITNGNYAISATGVSALIGPKVITALTTGVQYADVGVTLSDGVAALGWGQATRYTAIVTNHGSITAPSVTVSNTLPAQLTQASWTCAASPGSSCGATSGNGAIANTGSLLAGGTLTYTIDAAVVAGVGSASMAHSLRASVAGGVVDPDTTNNSAVDTNAVGTLRTLSFEKQGLASAGTINSTPSAIACGTGCSTASAQFLEGSEVVLTAAPAVGATFAGWGGACSGQATTCTVTVGANTAVTASFVGAPSIVSIAAGDAQSAVVTQAFGSPLSARVTDAGGTPVPGVTVQFAAPGQGASATLSGSSATTNAAGIASLNATANTTAGSYQATASVNGIATPARFSIQNLPGAVSALQIAGGTSQSARVRTTFGQALEVTLRDAYGNSVPNAPVTFTAPAAGATALLSSAQASSNAEGRATITAQASPTAGTYSVQVSSAGASGAFTLTNTAGDPANLQLVSGNSQNTTVAQGYAESLMVRVEDADGNAVPGATVSFTAPSNGASAQLSASALASNGSGLVKVDATANTRAGAFNVIAEVIGGQAPVSFALRNIAAAASAIHAAPTSTQQAAAADTRYPHPLEATVVDLYGNPVPNVSVTFSTPNEGSSATLDASQAHTDENGHVSIGATANTKRGSFSATAHAAGVETPATFALDVLSAAPSTVQPALGGNQTATVLGAFATPVTVRVLDAYGNPVAGVAVEVQLPALGASASLPPGPYVTDENGEVQLPLTANTVAGDYDVLVSIEQGAAPIVIPMHNQAGAAAALHASDATQAQATRVANAFAAPLTVEVRDAYGNPVAGKTVLFSAPGEGPTASLSASSAVTDSEGRASVQATASEQIGHYAVTAQIEGVEGISSFSLTNLAEAPAHLTLLSGGAQSTFATTAFAAPVVVRVADAHDNPVADLEVRITAPDTGSSLQNAPVARTEADGTASFTLAANGIPGTFQVALVAEGLQAPLPVALTGRAIPTRINGKLDTRGWLVGDSRLLSLTVHSEVDEPNGTLTVMDGAKRLASIPVQSGKASLPLTFNQPGHHQLLALFAAQGPYDRSESTVLAFDVATRPDTDDHDDHDGGNDGHGNGGDAGAPNGGDAPDPNNTGSAPGADGLGAGTSNSSSDDMLTLGGGGGCSVNAGSDSGLAGFALTLASVLVARRRRTR